MHLAVRNVLAGAALAGLTSAAIAQTGDSWPPPTPQGMEQATLTDQVLGMPAFVVNYPARWHFQGTVWQGTACAQVPAQIFRVTSPDGLITVERMPSFDWSWSTAPRPNWPAPGCLPFRQQFNAKEVAQGVASMLGVEYVRDVPVTNSAGENVVARNTQLNPNLYRSDDWAIADVRFKNGTYTMMGRLETNVTCFTTRIVRWRQDPIINNTCSAGVRYTVAPETQFQQVLQQMQTTVATKNPAWVQAWGRQLAMRTQQNIAAMNQATAASIAASKAAFDRQMAVQQRQSDDFNRMLQQGTDASLARAREISATQHTIASDYVDYALGEQTVRDPGTGELSKVPAGATYTWRNSTGDQMYQTSDPNANPNGSLDGTWSRQLHVHGDGSNP